MKTQTNTKSQTSFYLSEKDLKKIKKLQEIYDVRSASELIRILIQDEIDRVKKYEELMMN